MPGVDSYSDVQLFGGAITVCLPKEFADVSDIRQVPDSQEVYLDKNGFTSIIFDITERVDEATAATDEDAIKYHFSDIVSGTNDTTNVWSGGTATFAHIPNAPALTLFATQEPASHAPQRGRQPDFTGIILTLLRLKEQKTDIVISVNVPHTKVRGDYEPEDLDLANGKLTPLLESAKAAQDKILETFDFKDWSLLVIDE